ARAASGTSTQPQLSKKRSRLMLLRKQPRKRSRLTLMSRRPQRKLLFMNMAMVTTTTMTVTTTSIHQVRLSSTKRHLPNSDLLPTSMTLFTPSLDTSVALSHSSSMHPEAASVRLLLRIKRQT
ncbi:hypothetical protein IW150_007278, partial [Coemansia sp. RSA 2607]